MDDCSSAPFPHSPAVRRGLAQRLVSWFRRTARDLPWRRTRDLYAIWISEVMLQQTQVATVVPYYDRFLSQFPDVASLAAADEQKVLRLWEGLGYYRRARQLHAAAKQIVAEHRGEFPTNYTAVRALPGIGRYTAGAILSIGLDARLPILEANTVRVLSRLAAFQKDTCSSAGQKHLWQLAEAILPARDVGAFNQALMELGSEVCTPRSPDCVRCPLVAYCGAYRSNLQNEIPASTKKVNYEDVLEIAVVVRRAGRVLVRQCQPKERWAGLWDFPRFAASKDSIEDRLAQFVGVRATIQQHFATLKHGVTRFRITLECHEAVYRGLDSSSQGMRASTQWATVAELAELPLSVTGRQIAQLLAKSKTTRQNHPSAGTRGR